MSADAICGFTVALTSLPQYVAYAELAAVPGAKGIMLAGFPLFIYSFGSGSKWLAVGFTSLTALMAAADLDAENLVKEIGQEQYELRLALYSGLIGVMSLLLAAVGAGKVASKIPSSVLNGFKWAFSATLIAAQSPSMFFANSGKFYGAARAAAKAAGGTAVPGSSEALASSALLRGLWPWVNPLSWSLPTVGFALAAAVAVKRGRSVMPTAAPEGLELLLVVILCTAISAQTEYAGSVVGLLPTGSGDTGILATLFGTAPVDPRSLPWELVSSLAPKACVYAIISFASCSAICEGFKTEGGPEWSASRELFAHGISNVAAMFVGSPPIGASLSRSVVQKLAGAQTQMAGAFAGLTAIFLLPNVAPYLRAAPKATLAGIVVTGVINGVIWPEKFVKAVKSGDFPTAVVTFVTAVSFLAVGPTASLIGGSALHFSLELLFAKPKDKDRASRASVLRLSGLSGKKEE